MIRKTLHIIVASFILISTMGITINMHYCHDQLIDLAFNAPAHSCCEIDVRVQVNLRIAVRGVKMNLLLWSLAMTMKCLL